MRLWCVTRAPFVALDGTGAERHGGRYSPPGRPIVYLASEAGLAVLVTLRYLPRDLSGIDQDYVLGWTETKQTCLRVPADLTEQQMRAWVTEWARGDSSLLCATASKVLPEADIVMLNPRHRDGAAVRPLTTRPFSFAECLHVPPMQPRYEDQR